MKDNYSIFEKFDILGVRPHLRVKGNSIFHTPITIYLSILTFIIFFIICSFFSMEVLLHKRYTLDHNIDLMQNSSIDLSNHYFGLLITDVYGNELENFNRIFDIQIKFWQVYFPNSNDNSKNEDQIFKPYFNITGISWVECREVQDKSEVFKILANNYKSAICLDLSSQNLTLYGNYGSFSGYSMLNIYINQCNNITNRYLYDRSDCLRQSELDKFLLKNNLNIFSIEYNVNPHNPESPFVEYTKIDQIQISSTIFKNILKDYNYVIWNDDKGFIFEDISSIRSFRSEGLKESVDLSVTNSVYFGTFNQVTLRFSGKTEIFSRNYTKIQNSLAQIVGLLHIVFFSAKIMIYMGSKNSLLNFLIKETFDLRECRLFLMKDFELKEKKNEEKKIRIENKQNASGILPNLNNNENLNFNEPRGMFHMNDNNSFHDSQKQGFSNTNNDSNFQLMKNDNISLKFTEIKRKNNGHFMTENNINKLSGSKRDNFRYSRRNFKEKCEINRKNEGIEKSLSQNDMNNGNEIVIKTPSEIKIHNSIIGKESDEDILMNCLQKFFFRSCISDKNKKKFIDLADFILNRIMSVDYMLKIFNDFEKLKNLLLIQEHKELIKNMSNFGFEKHLENIEFIVVNKPVPIIKGRTK